MSLEKAKEFLATTEDDVVMAVGHKDTAWLFTDQLDLEVKFSRVTVSMTEDDTLIVGQYIGPRLEEGALTLPEGATIRWFKVTMTLD